MPSSTPKQKRTMAWVAHDPAASKKLGIPQDVARKFNRADQGLPETPGGPKPSGMGMNNYCSGGKVISTRRM